MVPIAEVEKLTFDPPDSRRATFASYLRKSVTSVLHDADVGIATTLSRDVEFCANSDPLSALDQLDPQVSARRG